MIGRVEFGGLETQVPNPNWPTNRWPYTMDGGGHSIFAGGPNLPSWTESLPPQGGRISFVGFAGLGAASDPRTQSTKRSRDVPGRGGYVYRQWYTGEIQVLAGPALVGTRITSASDPRRWAAITAEIGPYPKKKVDATGIALILSTLAQGSATVAQAVSPKQAQEFVPAEPSYTEPAGGGLPGWALPVGAGILGLLVVGAVVSRR
jgi:hypothetical protein